MIRRFLPVFLLICLSAGCGPEAKLQTKYHFPRIGVQHEGDSLYILVKAEVMIVCDLSYSVDGGKWLPVPNRQKLKSRKLKSTEKKPEYGINIVLRLPNMTTDSLRFRLTAIFPDGNKIDEIIKIEEVIDSFTPKSKVTFDPFSL